MLGEPQHAEGRARVRALLQRERGAGGEHVAVEVLGLRLVDHDRTARGIELARPVGIARAGGDRHRERRGRGERGEQARAAGPDGR